jgi:hypothetical protein
MRKNPGLFAAEEQVGTRLNHCAGGILRREQEKGAARIGEYGQAFRRTHDAKDPGPSGWAAVGARGVAVLDRIADTAFGRLLADRLAATQRSCFNLVLTCSKITPMKKGGV